MENEIKNKLKQIAYNEGCLLFGVADIKEIKKDFNINPKSVLDNLDYAISIGYVLSDPVLATNVDAPSQLYANHYKKINLLLEIAALKISSVLHENSYKALPVPVSQLLDFKTFSAHLSHRKIASLAGLGWFGKNNLLISPKFGAHVRYVSILTNCFLAVDKPLEITCSTDCNLCKDACPAGAIGNTPGDFDLKKCIEKLNSFARMQGVGQHICGICVNACSKRGV